MAPTVTLNNGHEFPVIGFGTYTGNPGEMEQVVKDAIDAGYRHIDTALFYKNEKEVGAAIRAKITEGVIKREDLFVTTKLWSTHHRPEVVVDTCKESLRNLGLDYVDLYLIHWPFGLKDGEQGLPMDENGQLIFSDVDYVDTWKAMEECVELGLTKSIGLSNFNSAQIQRVLDVATIRPVVNQVECHPYLSQNNLIEFCRKNGILITAYSPLGGPTGISPVRKENSPEPLKDPKIQQLADKYGKTSAQIILRYLVQHGVVPIPKSSNKKRLQENCDIFDFELRPEDMSVMEGLNRNARILDFTLAKEHKHYPFNIDY